MAERCACGYYKLDHPKQGPDCGPVPNCNPPQQERRWTIYSTHPAAKQHPPDPGCENCDGRGCMDCVMRAVHDKCEDDCPVCCADNFESTPIEVMPVADHKSQLEQAIEEFAERLAGEFERQRWSAERQGRGEDFYRGLAEAFGASRDICRTLATEGREANHE